MVLVRLLLAAFLLLGANATAVSRASAAEWPAARQFVLVEPSPPLHLGPPPSSVAETADGALLLRLYWPITESFGDGSISERPRTRVVRIARDGSRAFVPALERLTGIEGDDELLPLADGSILFTRE